MRITSKGQVTIPLAIRTEMGLLPNTEVEFILSRGKVLLVKKEKRSRRGRHLIARIEGRSSVRMSTDELMKLTRR